MRRKAQFALASLFILLAAASRAEACSCMLEPPPCAAFGAASAVFVGTATGVRTREAKSVEAARAEPDWMPVVVKFSVLQPFLGVEGAEVEVATGHGDSDCGYQFQRGETYLVYASRRAEGRPLVTGICHRTRPVSAASEDLEFLRGLGERGPGVALDIRVERSRERVKAGDARPQGGLASARLTVEGAGESREVRTDSEGRARVSGLRAGTHKVRLSLPEGLTTSQEEREVTVADRGCADLFFNVSDDGRVGGRVADAEGRPVAGVLVALVDAEDAEDAEPGRSYARYAETNGEGRYDFKGVPPGRYLLAVNLNRYPQPGDPTNAYRRTYYPSAAEPSQAEAVSIGAGERAKDRDITTPPRRAESVVRGVVVWDDGSPVAGAVISLRDVTYQDPGVDYGVAPADAQGRFTLKGHRGQVLLIRAASNRRFVGDQRRDGPMERAEPARLTLDGPTEAVKIVITKLR